jgi:hypothetical protein
MTLTATFVTMWMVCCLGAVTFASIAASSGRRWLFALSAAAAGAASWWWGPLDAPVAGALAAAAAAIYLFQQRYASVAIIAGGALGGMWPWLLRYDTVTTTASVAVSLGALVASAWLSRTRPSFAPSMLQEDALLILLAGGLTLGVLPGVLDGWQSAVTLTAIAAPASDTDVPVWLVAAVAGSLALGGVHSVWSRR